MEDLLTMILRLVEVVSKKETHQDYERVTRLAKDYNAYVTGIGLDEMMQRFTSRETVEAFDQRKEITQHIIPSVVSNITSVERKVPRSNGKTRVLTYENDSSQKRTRELEKVLAEYWGNQSLDDWMATRWLELNDIDPNAFVIVEWGDFDSKKEKAMPYPYESNAEEAVMFEYINNILQYLVDLKDFETLDWDGRKKTAQKYTMYLKQQTVQAFQVFDKEVRSRVNKDGEPFNLGDENKPQYYFRRNESEYFEVVILKPHKLGYVPAFRAGYKRDEATDGRTYVSPYHDCVPYLKKSIKSNSELDLTMALHAFPQKIITAHQCTNKKCLDGYVTTDGVTRECSVCKGTGFKVHTSTQDIIYVPLPRGKDEQLSLDNLARYITPEVALLEFQRQYIEYLTEECMGAVFNSDIFTTEEVATTATEKRIDLDNVYDTLYPLSVKFGRVWRFQVETIAKIRGEFKDLIATLTFSKDFKFKSKDDYIADRNRAKDAGAPDIVLRNIDDEIVKIDTAENPMEFIMYKTQQSFNPFSGKSDEEVAVLMATNTVPFEQKVFYANMGWIFDDVAMKNKDFYMMPRDKQAKILAKKTGEIINELNKTQTQAPQYNAE